VFCGSVSQIRRKLASVSQIINKETIPPLTETRDASPTNDPVNIKKCTNGAHRWAYLQKKRRGRERKRETIATINNHTTRAGVPALRHTRTHTTKFFSSRVLSNFIDGVFFVRHFGEVDFVSGFFVEVGLVDFRRFRQFAVSL